MRKANRKSLCILIALLAVLCLVFAACGDKNDKEAAAEDASVSEQTAEAEADAAAEEAEKAAAEEAAKAEEEAKAKAEEEAAKAEAEKKAAEEKAAQEKAAKEKAAKEKEDKAKKSSKSSKKKSSSKSDSKKSDTQKKEKKKVWVEPVTETRTVTLDTGTRYCHGANSGGGCGASWHGSKDGTYNSWHKHWQDYVKKRTKEEAEKGNVYVCDHIHDDSRWVPDTTTETVVVQEGYWKEVD